MTESPLRVFLDANVLAKPVTRTLLLVGGRSSGFVGVWSSRAEEEAARHLGAHAMSLSRVRELYGGDLTPTGVVGDRFKATSASDR